MTLHSFRWTCLFLAAALLPSTALARDAETTRELADAVDYTFDDDLVGATGRSSDLALLHVRTRKAARESLVRVREHFIPELYESVEDL